MPRLADLCPVPREALLGHLRPVESYAVTAEPPERRGALEMRRYLVSAASFAGAEIPLSLRLCIADPASPHVVLSVPGGGGTFDDEALWWLADSFRANYAAVDWIGRGQSPAHDAIVCRYDPIFLDGDTFRDGFLFHNLSAVWGVLNWLFHAGFGPVDVIGGSWGGVHSFLLAALDPRVERIYPSFGCGGFSLPGIEKRSMWDAAFEHMGPQRVAAWCAAFDPLLRVADIAAEVYYETAANDKFFSLDMAMETWARVRNPIFLGILANQDHDMKPFGVQPYKVQRLTEGGIAPCRAVTALRPLWDPLAGEVVCASLGDADPGNLTLVASEQHAAHGNMSREWSTRQPAALGDDAARFPLGRSHPDADVLYFVSGRLAAPDGGTLHAATPVYRAFWRADDLRIADVAPYRLLLDTRGADPLQAPIGDKNSPAITATTGGWSIDFTGVRRARATRFGLCPWRLPADWRSIEVVLAEPVPDGAAGLDLALSRRYQHFDEEAVLQSFGAAAMSRQGGLRTYRFPREGFRPGIVVEPRFRSYELPLPAQILGHFDAVGIVDLDGHLSESVVLVSLAFV